MKIPIVHQDDHLLVLNKPAGLLSAPDRHDADAPHLLGVLGSRYGKLLRVHRLDKGTSGLMVLAKTRAAHNHLNRQFEERQIEKVYLALCDGVPEPTEASIDEPIAPHPATIGKMMVSARGKYARTDYKVMEKLSDFSLVGVQIFTGRTHQIRVHLAYIGYPLMVDAQYGHRGEFLLSELKGRRYNLKKGEEERPLLARTALHSHRLAFTHPETGEWLAFREELPKDMRAVRNQLRKLSR